MSPAHYASQVALKLRAELLDIMSEDRTRQVARSASALMEEAPEPAPTGAA
jgi:hypothetical protein